MNIVEFENYHENKTHGDLIFPYNTYLCSIPLDFSEVPPHWHDEMEIIYIKKGQGIVAVDFRSHRVNAGTLVLILPGQLHSIEQYEDEKMEYENILFHPNMLLPKKADTSSLDFIQPLLHGKITVPTVFTPVYPYYKDDVMLKDFSTLLNRLSGMADEMGSYFRRMKECREILEEKEQRKEK